jgi:FKBP-type peptidyl-prolyl cis-trans isomerase FkpA
MRATIALRRVAGLTGSYGAAVGAAVALAFVLVGCQEKPAEPEADAATAEPAFANDDAKAAYSLGYAFTENITRQFGNELDVDAFVRGVRDQFSGADAAIAEEEAQTVLSALIERKRAEAAAQASANLDNGLKFLEENARREGVVVTDSGLQYEVLNAGEGGKPGPSDVVTTHYEGRLIDGTVFDSSIARGEPVTFSLDGVIAGWTQGLQLMSPGAKYRLYVPAALAYGPRANGNIPANSTLVFDVELIKVEPQPAAEAAPDSPAAED